MSMNTKKQWQVAVKTSCMLGEGPFWDEKLQRLLWVDIVAGDIHEWYTASSRHVVTHLPMQIAAVTLDNSGLLIAASDRGIVQIDLATQAITPLVDPEAHLPNNRFNDAKCDPLGRFWAGTMDAVTQLPGAGSLYMLDNAGRLSTKISGVTCSNGLAWSADRQTFYYIDSPTRQVYAFDFEAYNGTLSNRRVVIEIPASEGLPDGMTIDRTGMLWIALWGGWKVACWNPYSGNKQDEILLPVSQVTSCVFGGADLTDLYVTSARTGLTEQEQRQQPLAGSLFVVRKVMPGGTISQRIHI